MACAHARNEGYPAVSGGRGPNHGVLPRGLEPGLHGSDGASTTRSSRCSIDYDAVIVGISVDSAWCHAALTNLFGCARGLILRERDERGQHHAAEPHEGYRRVM